MNPEQSLQEKYAPQNMCFGCGAANPDGLHIRSFLENSDESRASGEVVAEWKPQKKYEAFEGVLNGGIIGTLLDCHCNWTAAYHLMKRAGENRPPCTVTAEYAIKLLRPTPTNDSVFLSAKVVEISDDRASIEGTLSAAGKVCATCRGVFVAAAVLKQVDGGQEKLDRFIPYQAKDILEHAPVTKAHLKDGGMTLGALCEAAIEQSDNTAGNLLLDTIGGPIGVTNFTRGIG